MTAEKQKKIRPEVLDRLGALIASLASLLSFEFLAKEYPDKNGAFWEIFTMWNLLSLFAFAAEVFWIGMTVR